MLLLKSLQPRQVKKITSLPANLDNVIGLITRIEEIKKDDLILVYEDEVIPLDCKIIKGTTEIDESMLTGESLPVTKMEGSMIFSGTKNITSKIAAKVERDYRQSTISKIIEAIEKAQNTSFKTQKAVDMVISIFVPSVIAIAFLTFFGWIYVNGNIESSLINAVSVLVISCPCALGIATPLALLISTNIATKNGIIIKNGDILEEMRHIKNIFFDKTGTLTEGKLTVSRVITTCNTDKMSLLSYAASIEKHSFHPIAKGLLDYYDGDLLPVETVREIPGKGVTGKTKDGTQIAAGNIGLMSDIGISIDNNAAEIIKKLQQKGHITVLVAIDGNLSGIIAFKDRLKKDTTEVLQHLYEKHYSINVVTGDNEISANTILADVRSQIKLYTSMTPFDKAELIREQENRNIKTIFIGDGINDAPSIKSATVGIAMGSGSELAIETSDAVVLNNSLKSIVKLLNLSHYTLSTIKINLFWAFIYNILMIPLAASGHIHPIISAGSMSVSSIIVVLNSLRLRLYDLYKI